MSTFDMCRSLCYYSNETQPATIHIDDYAVMLRVTTYRNWCNDTKLHAHFFCIWLEIYGHNNVVLIHNT